MFHPTYWETKINPCWWFYHQANTYRLMTHTKFHLSSRTLLYTSNIWGLRLLWIPEAKLVAMAMQKYTYSSFKYGLDSERILLIVLKTFLLRKWNHKNWNKKRVMSQQLLIIQSAGRRSEAGFFLYVCWNKQSPPLFPINCLSHVVPVPAIVLLCEAFRDPLSQKVFIPATC